MQGGCRTTPPLRRLAYRTRRRSARQNLPVEVADVDFQAWVNERGLEALAELVRSAVEELAGSKGKHPTDRAHYHCGRTRCELGFGGLAMMC